MMCENCSKLAFLYTKKACVRCQSSVIISLAVLCELCSFGDKICSVCLKKIQIARPARGCNCGHK